MTAWAVPIYKEDNVTADRRIMCGFASRVRHGGRNFCRPYDAFYTILVSCLCAKPMGGSVGLRVVQVLLWSMSSSLEPRVNRFLRAGKMSIVTAVIGGSLCAAVVVIDMVGGLTVSRVLVVICVAQSLLIMAQLRLSSDAESGSLQYTKRVIFLGPPL